MLKKFSLFALSALALSALTACQSGEEAMKVICYAHDHVDASLAPGEKAIAVAQYVDDNLKHGEARRGWEALAHASADSKGEMLRAMGRELGYTAACPLADAMKPVAPPAAGAK